MGLGLQATKTELAFYFIDCFIYENIKKDGEVIRVQLQPSSSAQFILDCTMFSETSLSLLHSWYSNHYSLI